MPELRDLLELPSRYVPTPQQLSKLKARLHVASAPPSPPRAAHGATLLKIFTGGVVLLAVGLGASSLRPEPVSTLAPRPRAERVGVDMDTSRSDRSQELSLQVERAADPRARLAAGVRSGDSAARLTLPPAPEPAGAAMRGDRSEHVPPTAAVSDSAMAEPAPSAVLDRAGSEALRRPARRAESPAAPAKGAPRLEDSGPLRSAGGTPDRARPPTPSELALLGAAQALLAHDPQAALEHLSEHARLYRRGQFAEEREALAVDALRRLGRRAELRERAEAFLAKYPRAPQRERIEQWLR